jgi:hypothetical protein
METQGWYGVHTVAQASTLFNCYLTAKIHILLVYHEENIIKREIDHELGEYNWKWTFVVIGLKIDVKTKVVELNESYMTCLRSICKNWLR